MRKALITLCVIFISAAVNAETINLLSGKPIEGEVVYVAEDYIKIDTGDGVLKIFYDQMGWKQAEGFQAIWEERAGADGEVEPEEPDLITLLEFDGSEQMIEVVYETN